MRRLATFVAALAGATFVGQYACVIDLNDLEAILLGGVLCAATIVLIAEEETRQDADDRAPLRDITDDLSPARTWRVDARVDHALVGGTADEIRAWLEDNGLAIAHVDLDPPASGRELEVGVLTWASNGRAACRYVDRKLTQALLSPPLAVRAFPYEPERRPRASA